MKTARWAPAAPEQPQSSPRALPPHFHNHHYHYCHCNHHRYHYHRGGEGKAMKVNESATKINENHKEPQVPLRYSHRGGEGKPIKIIENQ